MSLCMDCRNEVLVKEVYQEEVDAPCARCGWSSGKGEDEWWIWEINLSSDVEWSDEEVQEFIDELEKCDSPDV